MTGPGVVPPLPAQPPRAGRGSGRVEWAAYAQAHGLAVAADARRDAIVELCDEHGLVAVADTDAAGAGERGPSQATALRRLALDRYEFGCTADGAPFAVAKDGPRVARTFRGGRTGLRAELAKLYARQAGGAVPAASALADALTVLEGEAAETDPVPLALRVADHAGTLLLDLGHVDGRVAQVTPGGWRVLDCCPVLFRRTALTGVLPDPARPGDLAPLRARLNVSDDDWPLVLGWLVAALFPDIPHPVLALLGEQGTGKTTATKNVATVLDPSPVPTRAAPRDEDSWSVAAAGSWVVGLDNLSKIEPWYSDSLCRAVTGDGRVRRQLYTDGDLSVVAFRRVIVANGIDFGNLAPDLADRTLSVDLLPIGAADRRRDRDALLVDDRDRAAVLAGLLDLAAQVLAELPAVALDRMPRMADFARILAALDHVLGTTSLDRYADQAAALARTVADSSPFIAAVRALVDPHDTADDGSPDYWTGSPKALMAALPVPDPRPRDWPTTPQGVAAALRRAAPALRQIGYGVEKSATLDPATRQAIWTINRPSPGTTTTARPSKAHPEPSEPSQPSDTAADLRERSEGSAEGSPNGHPRTFGTPGSGEGSEGSPDRQDGNLRGTFGRPHAADLHEHHPAKEPKDPKDHPEPSSAAGQLLVPGPAPHGQNRPRCSGCYALLADEWIHNGWDICPRCDTQLATHGADSPVGSAS